MFRVIVYLADKIMEARHALVDFFFTEVTTKDIPHNVTSTLKRVKRKGGVVTKLV